jgi:tetratricopeptide (TPR) repeat protein
MYRQLQQFDKAVANFRQAAKLDPTHIQSYYNLGIVYAQDLKRNDDAIKAWTKVIQINPASPQAVQAQQFIAQLKQGKP